MNFPDHINNLSILITAITLYVLIIGGAFYINILWGVPRLLLKGRASVYFISIGAVTAVVIISFLILQWNLFSIKGKLSELDPFKPFLNIISSSLEFGLVIAGITALMLFKHWFVSGQRFNEMESGKLQTELKYLKAQINPHFLFNMLNNANVLLKEKKGGGAHMLSKLEELLRYQMSKSNQDEIILSADIYFLNDFLNLEKIRRDGFEYNITVEGNPSGIVLPPLLFIPFVENAVKHSQDSDRESYLHIVYRIEQGGLHFHCRNSRPAAEENAPPRKVGGLGLKNIQRRLELLFPNRHLLKLVQTDKEYIVDLHLELNRKHNHTI